ncbi:MAG: transglycosylase domain-containing protein, partial [Alphaproteobacteria bacterium]
MVFSFLFKDLPSPNKLITRKQIVSTKIYDRHGQLLYKIYRNQNRSLVKLEEIPLSLIQATIAIEDAEFYHHRGFSLKGIFRAFFKNLKGDKLYGGSTITQQLVKNALLSPERTWRRKIRELLLALGTEILFSKDEILQMYLNEVGYGGAAYGVEEAAQKYFGKSVRDLNLAESALLAGLPASPTTYSPFGTHPEKAKERQALVLRRMVEEKFITPQQAEQARAQELHFVPQRTDINAPHFVMYVKELLVKKYGQQMVEEGGLEVKTSLDLEIQKMAQKIVSREIKKLAPLRVSNGAALVTNPQTGEILAMVGSRDYFDLKNDGNVNVTLRPRQPGSAIKPITYSLALENGFTAASLLSDTPVTYRLPGQKPYSPRNYDGRFHGQIPLRVALASSYNVPAVKILAALGVEKMIQRGQAMGITTWDDPARFGLSLTLGGGEVKMTDLAVVYGTLANLGRRVDLNPILEVKNYRGEILETKETDQPPAGKPVLSPAIAYLLTDILADNRARTPTFGPRSVLNIPGHPHVAVKTGTTQNLRDNWTIGYTPDYLVAVWVGNNDNTPMSYVASGITGASPIWQQIMTNLLRDVPDKEFPRPENLRRVEICPSTGTLPCEGCGGYWE